MAAFTEQDLNRFDAEAIVRSPGGFILIEEHRHPACREWLVQHGYRIDSVDFRRGLSEAVPALGRMLEWHERFGYSLEPDNRNLDALHDGFEFQIPDGGGRVLELIGAEVGYLEDSSWMLELLWIAQMHSLKQLALGRRFFALVVVQNDQSPMIGATVGRNQIPIPFWDPWRKKHDFLC